MKNLMVIAGALALAATAPAHAQDRPTGMYGLKLSAQDFDKAAQFYTLLGMARGPKFGNNQELHWDAPAKGSAILLVPRKPGEGGGNYLMISVADVPATAARLKAAGFPVTGEPRTNPRATVLLVKDPDGNTVELMGGPGGAPAPAH